MKVNLQDGAKLNLSTARPKVKIKLRGYERRSAVVFTHHEREGINNNTTDDGNFRRITAFNDVTLKTVRHVIFNWNRLAPYLPNHSLFQPRPKLDRIVGLTIHCFVLSLLVLLVVSARALLAFGHFATFLTINWFHYKGFSVPLQFSVVKMTSHTPEDFKSATLFTLGDLHLILARVHHDREYQRDRLITQGNNSIIYPALPYTPNPMPYRCSHRFDTNIYHCDYRSESCRFMCSDDSISLRAQPHHEGTSMSSTPSLEHPNHSELGLVLGSSSRSSSPIDLKALPNISELLA